jgi:hypothetical protein
LYWSKSKPNFGDAMSPLMCERLAGCPVVFADRWRCDLVAMGSLLDRFREWYPHPRVHVWGTGFIEERPSRRGRFHYHAVRGHLSAQIVRGPSIDTFGDPGLLADVLWPELKKTPKGLVPHFQDRTDPQVAALRNTLPGCTVIDVFGEVVEVLREIAACECVLSSSLHGLVVADAFGVPNAWVKFSEKVRGGGFKFRDYYSIYAPEMPAVPLLPEQLDAVRIRTIHEQYTRPGLDQIKDRLLTAFPFKP